MMYDPANFVRRRSLKVTLLPRETFGVMCAGSGTDIIVRGGVDG